MIIIFTVAMGCRIPQAVSTRLYLPTQYLIGPTRLKQGLPQRELGIPVSFVHSTAVPWVFDQFGGSPQISRILATPTPAVGTALRFLAGSQLSSWGLACQAGLAALLGTHSTRPRRLLVCCAGPKPCTCAVVLSSPVVLGSWAGVAGPCRPCWPDTENIVMGRKRCLVTFV